MMAAVGRRIFLKHFLAAFDARSARQAIPVVVRDRLANRNMTEPEKVRMRRLAKRTSGWNR